MLCPFCNHEMEAGVIQCPSPIGWSPKKYFFSTKNYHSDIVEIAPPTFKGMLCGTTLPALHCGNCKKVIVDYSNEKGGLQKYNVI